MPSILFINRVCPPERGATGYRLADIAQGLAAQGWSVTILTATSQPNAIPGVQIVPAFRRALPSRLPRVLVYAAAFIGLAVKVLTLPRHDVTVTMTDPPLLAALGPLRRVMRGGRLIHWSQDVYPDLLAVLGGKWGCWLAGLLAPLMVWALCQHDAVIAIGECMAARLKACLPADFPVHIVRNPADPKITAKAESSLRRKLGLTDSFVVAYAGTLGLAHRFNALFMAARLSSVDVAFLIVGAGSAYAGVRAEAERVGLANVHFLPWVPDEQLSDMLAAADMHVVTMASQTMGLLVPSKVAGVLAAGKPCLFVGPADCDAARLIADAGCGVVVNPDDPQALAAAIKHFRTSPELLKSAAERARDVAARFYGVQKAVTAFEVAALSVVQQTDTAPVIMEEAHG